MYIGDELEHIYFYKGELVTDIITLSEDPKKDMDKDGYGIYKCHAYDEFQDKEYLVVWTIEKEGTEDELVDWNEYIVRPYE